MWRQKWLNSSSSGKARVKTRGEFDTFDPESAHLSNKIPIFAKLSKQKIEVFANWPKPPRLCTKVDVDFAKTAPELEF